MLEVRASGGKTFYQRYTDARGRERQFKLGPAEILTLDQARRKARLSWRKPWSAKTRSSSAARCATPTLSEFVRDRYLPHVKSYKRSWCTDRSGRPGEERGDLGLLEAMRQKGYASGTTNRVLILLRYIYNLGRKWRVAGMAENPTLGLSTAPDVQRDRFLTAEETQRLIAGVGDRAPTETTLRPAAADPAAMLCCAPGAADPPARRNEITQAKWDYVRLERRTLLVPLSKSGKPRAIALNGQALALLRAIPRHDGNPFVFPSPVNGKPRLAVLPLGPHPQAPPTPMCGCTICGTPMRASWSTRGSRSTSCRGCSGMHIRAPRSATPTSRTKPCWRLQSASPDVVGGGNARQSGGSDPVSLRQISRRRRHLGYP